MHAQEILNLMEFWAHCHECGALMVTVPGGAVCPHCGFELDDPEEATVLAIRSGAAKPQGGFWSRDDRPFEILDEVA